jgi:hypothetical protein
MAMIEHGLDRVALQRALAVRLRYASTLRLPRFSVAAGSS